LRQRIFGQCSPIPAAKYSCYPRALLTETAVVVQVYQMLVAGIDSNGKCIFDLLGKLLAAVLGHNKARSFQD
jgi:hypothetical protein